MQTIPPTGRRSSITHLIAASFMALALAASGGGGSDTGQRETAAAADQTVVDRATGTVRFVESTAGGGQILSDTPFLAGDKTGMKASAADVSTMTAASSGREQAQVVNPTPCKVYRFAFTQGCLQTGPDISLRALLPLPSTGVI